MGPDAIAGLLADWRRQVLDGDPAELGEAGAQIGRLAAELDLTTSMVDDAWRAHARYLPSARLQGDDAHEHSDEDDRQQYLIDHAIKLAAEAEYADFLAHGGAPDPDRFGAPTPRMVPDRREFGKGDLGYDEETRRHGRTRPII